MNVKMARAHADRAWKSLSPKARSILLAIIAACIIAILIAVTWPLWPRGSQVANAPQATTGVSLSGASKIDSKGQPTADLLNKLVDAVNQLSDFEHEAGKAINSLVAGQKALNEKVKAHESAIETNQKGIETEQKGLKAALDSLTKLQTQQGTAVKELSERDVLIREIKERLKTAPPVKLETPPAPLSSLEGPTGNFLSSSVA